MCLSVCLFGIQYKYGHLSAPWVDTHNPTLFVFNIRVPSAVIRIRSRQRSSQCYHPDHRSSYSKSSKHPPFGLWSGKEFLVPQSGSEDAKGVLNANTRIRSRPSATIRIRSRRKEFPVPPSGSEASDRNSQCDR